MKSISLLVLLMGFSVQNAYAEKVTVNAKELERIYQLQESKAGLSFPLCLYTILKTSVI